MKILFFIDNLRSGGKERRLTELMKALKLFRDIQFELITMDEEIHYKEVLNLNITIHFLIRKTKKDLSVFPKFYNICKRYRPDIVHCWNDMTAIIAVPACKLLHIKLVNGMVADTPVKRNLLNKSWLRAKLTFPFSDKIIGNSTAGLEGYGATNLKSCCIYNGMDFNRFANLKDANILRKEILGDDNKSSFIIGMVAAFEPRKDYKTLIKAALSLLNIYSSLRFVLVGNGTEFNEVKNSVPLEFRDKIFFLGKRTDVEEIVNLFDVGVLLSNAKIHGEGISNSIIEYMALGKPVIATRGGGTNEAIIDEQNGFLISPGNPEELAGCIEKLIANKELRSRLGNKALEIAHKKFDLKVMTENYIKVYQKLIRENNN